MFRNAYWIPQMVAILALALTSHTMMFCKMSRRLGAQVKPTMKNLDNAEDILLDRLRVIELVRERTEPNYQSFLKQRRELIEIEQAVTNTLRRAQVSVIIWSRVHGQIATGEGSGGFSFGALSALLVGYAL